MEAPKILVVDDESRMRKLVKDFLEKKNFHVLEAGDGEEAMDIFYEEKSIGIHVGSNYDSICACRMWWEPK